MVTGEPLAPELQRFRINPNHWDQTSVAAFDQHFDHTQLFSLPFARQ